MERSVRHDVCSPAAQNPTPQAGNLYMHPLKWLWSSLNYFIFWLIQHLRLFEASYTKSYVA